MKSPRALIFFSLLAAAGASSHAQSVDCSGTLLSWSITNPELAAGCHCVSANQLPVCSGSGSGGAGAKLDLSGYYDFNRISPFGPETGLPFFTLRYGDNFRDWHEEAMARWRAYLIRNRLAKEGIFVSPDNPAASLIEWLYRVLAGLKNPPERSASLFATLDDSPVKKESSDFEENYINPEFFRKDDPVIGPLSAEIPEVSGNMQQCLAEVSAPARSMPPGFGLAYNSLYGGQAETVAMKIEQFPDGRAVFTDSSNTRWTFRPSDGGASAYYRQSAGSPYRLAVAKDGWRVETADGDRIEFLPSPEQNKWRPSRYNAADGSWLTYEYGPNGLSRITDMHGRYFAFERDAKGLPQTLSDEQGRKTVFTYDQQGRATGVAYPDGSKKTFGYDAAGFLAAVNNGSLAGEQYTYDGQGRVLTSESEGGVNRQEHYYNDAGSKTVITDGLGNKTEYSYSSDHGQKLITSVTDALGGKAAMSYDGNFNVASATDQLGRASKYVRNANGEPETVVDALGSTTTIQYQVKRNYRDDYGERTDYYSRPIKITDALGRTTKLDYDSYGNLEETEDALGSKTSMDYDHAGHLLELRDAMGSTYKYEYANGLSKAIDPLGRVTRYERDADLHVTKLTDPLGRNTTFTYDMSGNITSVTNPQGFVTKFAYGNGACPSCGGSQLSALTDPKGNAWTFGYDQYGRLADTSNPLGQKKAYQYDKMSRLTEMKDPAGNITAFTYDALNRLTKKDIRTPAGEHSITDYTYDAVGNLLSASNATSSVSFVYDALNRAVETTQTIAGKAYTIGYSFDAVGNRMSMTTPWGKYSYTYDALNRQTGIVTPQGIAVAFSYDAAGRRIKKTIVKNVLAILAEASYTYDAVGQLLNITNKAGGKVVAFANYEYDAVGNRVKREDQDGTIKYGYDASNRLITAEPVPMNMAEAEVFIYDRNGNRRYDRGAWDYKYDAANRVLYNSTYTYTHDFNGNLTSRTEKASSSTITYSYNPEQQLSEVTTLEHKIHYRYDPLDRRIEKAVDGNIQRYVYDNEDIIAILDARSTQTETFTHGPGIDEPLVMTKVDGKNYYYHADGLGSIKAITTDNKQIVETYIYKSYGETSIRDYIGAVLNESSIGNPYFFTARELDSESAQYYYRARYYDWRRGAFTQEDPVGFKGGDVNLFRYATDIPNLFIDPYGKDIWVEGPSGGEPAGHLSLNVGDPSGAYSSYSFGVTGKLWKFNGEVYRDRNPGGEILVNYYLYSTASENATVKGILDAKLGDKAPYRPWRTCRNFSLDEFEIIKSLGIGVPGKPQVRRNNKCEKSEKVPFALSTSAWDQLNFKSMFSSGSSK